MMTQSGIIKAIIKNASSKKREDIEEAWLRYLQTQLDFPFMCEVNLFSYSEALADGDIVKVIWAEDFIDLYGMLMKIKKGRKTLYSPLAELKVLDTKSKNHIIVNAYLDWEANY